MPMVSVTMFPGRTPDQKRAMVEEVTDALVRTCDAQRGDVWVVINEVSREHWSLGGKLYSEQ
jgi:4-oxalocrotonate tautomerase